MQTAQEIRSANATVEPIADETDERWGTVPVGRAVYDCRPFVRGTGQWQGVVQIKRPSMDGAPGMLCQVKSARTLDFNGLRAIVTEALYAMVKHYFGVEDELSVYVYAELKDGHLEYYERASQIEFFITAGGAHVMYPCGGREV